MNYLTTCPSCGGQLVPHVGHAQSAPWLCQVCRHGFFACELSADARVFWRPTHRDFGFNAELGKVLHRGRQTEVGLASERGTCVRVDQVSLLTKAERTLVLSWLANRTTVEALALVKALEAASA